MFYDANGHPDRYGQYEKIGDRLVLRNGAKVHFDITQIRDGGASGQRAFLTDNSLHVTDGERAFADSAEGKEAIAYAKSVHDLNGWRAGPWNDQMERQAIADALASSSRTSPISDAALADSRAQEEAAYQRSVAALNRHRN